MGLVLLSPQRGYAQAGLSDDAGVARKAPTAVTSEARRVAAPFLTSINADEASERFRPNATPSANAQHDQTKLMVGRSPRLAYTRRADTDALASSPPSASTRTPLTRAPVGSSSFTESTWPTRTRR